MRESVPGTAGEVRLVFLGFKLFLFSLINEARVRVLEFGKLGKSTKLQKGRPGHRRVEVGAGEACREMAGPGGRVVLVPAARAATPICSG